MSKRVVLAVLLIAALPAVLQAGDNPKFTFGSGQIGFMTTTVPPEYRCAGGDLTGAFPPCSEETRRVFVRSEQQLWVPVGLSESIEALMAGEITFVVNCNFNAQYRGPCWGTFTWEVEGGATWEGQWTAPVMDLMTYESEIALVGFGQGGAIDGMQLKIDGYSNPGDWYITVTARVGE